MIKINLLRFQKIYQRKKPVPPLKVALPALAVILLIGAGIFLLQYFGQHSGMGILGKKKNTSLKKEATSFDMVEDIVDDIRGGRFKVRGLQRLSSPAQLSVNERKAYERFFVKKVFNAFNTHIRPGLGFHTITLDSYGNFFIYGLTHSRVEANAFREDLKKEDCILKADELEFKKKFGKRKLRFILKGFLNHNLKQFKKDDIRERKEILQESPKSVLGEVIRACKSSGVGKVRKVEWGDVEPYGAGKRQSVRIQMESTYGALMRWIRRVYEKNLQIGYSKINLTPIGASKILVAVELYIYARS
jgi:hypothetical protein